MEMPYQPVPAGNIHAASLGHQPMFAYFQRMEMAGTALNLSQRQMLQCARTGVNPRTGEATLQRPGQPLPVAQEQAQPPSAPSQPRQRRAAFAVGVNEVQRLRNACPLELGEDYEATFKDRLMLGGTFNSQRHRPMSEAAANEVVAKFIRGCAIGQMATDVQPEVYPALGFEPGTTHTNSSTLFDFLEHRIPMMAADGELERLAIRQGWCNAATTSGTSRQPTAVNDQRGAMLKFRDLMFGDTQLVRNTFPMSTGADADRLFVRDCIEGGGREAMSPREALLELERYHKGFALMIRAAQDGPCRPLLDTAERTIRDRLDQLQADGEITEWAMQHQLVRQPADCVAMRTSINYYVECTNQSASSGRGRGRPSETAPPVVRSPAPPQVGARRRRHEA